MYLAYPISNVLQDNQIVNGQLLLRNNSNERTPISLKVTQ